jgi:hypothetical protein
MKSISMQLGIPDSQSRRRDTGDWNVRLNSPMLVTGLVVFVGYYLGAKIGFALTFQRIRFRSFGLRTLSWLQRFC